jgi:hypothetical protein
MKYRNILRGYWPGSKPIFNIFIFSLPSLLHRKTGKLQQNIRPAVQVSPETSIHRKKPRPGSATPAAFEISKTVDRGKGCFLKWGPGRLQKKKERTGKRSLRIDTLRVPRSPSLLNPD